jgi:type IV pilus assembly protein PilB
MAKRRRLGEVLHQRGHVLAEDLNQALQEQRGKLIHLGELLLQRGTVSKPDLISALGEVGTLAYIDCTAAQVSAEVLKTIPAEIARRHDVLPVKVHNGKLTVAMAEPQNLRLIDELRFKRKGNRAAAGFPGTTTSRERSPTGNARRACRR